MSMPRMPYPPPHMQPHPPRKPWWKRTWVIATAAGLLGFFLGLPTDSTTADPEPAPTVTATVTVTAEPEPAPTVTVTVTAEPPTQPTPTAEPTAASEQPADDLGAAVLAAIDNGMPGGRNAWAQPITDIETVSSSTVRVHYQETLTDADAQDVGRKVLTFARFTVPQLETVVIRDTSGVDRNVR